MRQLRIGAGAGFAGDRIDAAVELVVKGELDYVVCECLAERTIALAQGAKHAARHAGYDPLLQTRMRALLPLCCSRGTRLISNMGAADPIAAALEVVRIAEELGLTGLRIAAVTGDDVLSRLSPDHPLLGEPSVLSALPRVVSANAYLGADGIVEALAGGADVVITGRVADASLFLAPMIHHFGWDERDWDVLGKGTAIGHLLECAGQLTGGYFADPGVKQVANLARLGFPLAEVDASGEAVVTKVPGSGGRLDRLTCTEQLLYELHDPARYLTPDVTADFSDVRFDELAPNRVRVSGASGRERPAELKLLVGYIDSYVGEGQMSYAGSGALARARLALEIVETRLATYEPPLTEVRFDIIGYNAVARPRLEPTVEPEEVRIRAVGRANTMDDARRVGQEVEALYTNGPAGGGGAFKSVQEVIGIAVGSVSREIAKPEVHRFEITGRRVFVRDGGSSAATSSMFDSVRQVSQPQGATSATGRPEDGSNA